MSTKPGWLGVRAVEPYDKTPVTVEQWEPAGAGMCDVLVRRDDGTAYWTATHMLRPVLPDGTPDTTPRLTRAEGSKLHNAT